MGWITKNPKKNSHDCHLPDPNTVGLWSVWSCGGWRGCGKVWTVIEAGGSGNRFVEGHKKPTPASPSPKENR